jgi:hypothetical protein
VQAAEEAKKAADRAAVDAKKAAERRAAEAKRAVGSRGAGANFVKQCASHMPGAPCRQQAWRGGGGQA